MALQSGIQPGLGHRMSRTFPAMRQAHSPPSLLKATVHRRTRSVPVRKNCVSVTQIQCPVAAANAICIGRVSYLRQPGVKTRTHGTSESGGWQCGWDGHLQDSSHVEREGDSFQVMTPEGPKQLRQLQSQKRRGVFQNLADAALMVLYLYKMPIPLFSIPALSIAHSYAVIMAVYMCSEWHAFAHRADCTGKTLLQSLQAFAQQTWSTYAADHTLYHVPLEIHAVLTTFQKIVPSVYLQQVLTSKVACMLVSFSALYVALSILRRGLL